MDNVVEISFSNLNSSLAEILAAEIDRQLSQSNAIDPSKINLLELLEELDLYIKGKDRIELVKSIKECRVNIFGTSSLTGGWGKYIKNSNVKFNDPVHYEDAIEIMKQSKIILSSCPEVKNGADERTFAALGCGALVITNHNLYLQKHFRQGKEMLFYQPGKWQSVNEHIHHYLSQPELLEKIASSGQEKTLREHNWDVRAKELINKLSSTLEKMHLNEI